MKSLLFCFIFIWANYLNGQNSLWVELKRCKDIYSYSGTAFSLFKNDSLVNEYHMLISTELVSDLPDGKYHIEFETLFGKRKSEYFVLDKNDPDQEIFGYTLEFCIDQLPGAICKQEQLYIDMLSEGEEIYYDYSFSGCFSSWNVQFTLRKEGGKYYILYKGRKRKVKEKNLPLLREFECELRNVVFPNYTSTSGGDTKITYNGQSVSFSGPSGHWEGYHYLMKELRLKL